MSTRKGEAIFLDDVLNEAKNRALEAIKTSPSSLKFLFLLLILVSKSIIV